MIAQTFDATTVGVKQLTDDITQRFTIELVDSTQVHFKQNVLLDLMLVHVQP